MTQNHREVMQQALEALEKQQQALKVYPNYTLDPHECEAIDAAEKAITNLREALAAQAMEVVAFAGVKVWVGDQQVVQCLTQDTLRYAHEPWTLMLTNAEMCIAALKENT